MENMNFDEIKEPFVIDLSQYIDDRGILYEVIHDSDKFMDKFGQVYVVKDPRKDTIRAYHKHEKLWDYFHIANGSAKFVIFKTHEFNSNLRHDISKDKKIFVLSSVKPQLLIVPAGWYHGWMSLEDNTILISTANQEYNKENPDEERVDPFLLGECVWKIKAK